VRELFAVSYEKKSIAFKILFRPKKIWVERPDVFRISTPPCSLFRFVHRKTFNHALTESVSGAIDYYLGGRPLKQITGWNDPHHYVLIKWE